MTKKKRAKRPVLKTKPILVRFEEDEHFKAYQKEAKEEGRDFCSYIRHRLRTHPDHKKSGK